DECPCARALMADLAEQAYRPWGSETDLRDLLQCYAQGCEAGNFESGIRRAVQAMLASPHFLFRIEPQPASVRAGGDYRVSDRALASRLSYFLWGEPPDGTLLKLAEDGRLHDLAVLDAQVVRLL